MKINCKICSQLSLRLRMIEILTEMDADLDSLSANLLVMHLEVI